MPRLPTVFFLLALLIPTLASAQESAGQLTLPEKSDVRMIVDISGSMKENDPDNLRQPAVRLLARMLPEGSSSGLWTFGQYVNMLVPHSDVDDAWRETLVNRSDEINSVALRTNLGKAIEVASDDYFTDGTLANTHFILLTDGKVDVSDEADVNRREEQRILNTLVPALVAKGATFHPVALSADADAEFLKQIASESGGRFQIADSAEALNLAFLEALNTAVPQEQIPIEGNAFNVDSGVKEFTALIFWGSEETKATRTLELVRPDGETVTLEKPAENMRWAREAGYDLMTVQEPMAGEWRLTGELGKGSRVTVVSDLRMMVSSLPASFTEEEPVELSVAFFEEGEQITNRDFLQVLDVTLTLTSADGRSGQKLLSGAEPPDDGVYSDRISQLPAGGLYTIDVVADGQTFARKFSTTIEFNPLTDSASLAPETEEVTDAGAAGSADAAEPAEQKAEEEVTPPEAETSAEPAIESPIDISEVETPEPDQTPAPSEPELAEEPVVEEQESMLPVPLWSLAAGAGALVLAILLWLLVKRAKQRKAEQGEPAEKRETVADLEQASEPEPDAESDSESEPEPEQEPEPEPESESELESEPEPEPESEPEPEKKPEADPEPEEIPEVTEAAEPEESEDDQEIPIADSVVADEAPAENSEGFPELDDLDDVLKDFDDVLAEEDEEEFGLDDFDLSEFDDLPDYDEADTSLPDDKSDKQADDKDQKK